MLWRSENNHMGSLSHSLCPHHLSLCPPLSLSSFTLPYQHPFSRVCEVCSDEACGYVSWLLSKQIAVERRWSCQNDSLFTSLRLINRQDGSCEGRSAAPPDRTVTHAAVSLSKRRRPHGDGFHRSNASGHRSHAPGRRCPNGEMRLDNQGNLCTDW